MGVVAWPPLLLLLALVLVMLNLKKVMGVGSAGGMVLHTIDMKRGWQAGRGNAAVATLYVHMNCCFTMYVVGLQVSTICTNAVTI